MFIPVRNWRKRTRSFLIDFRWKSWWSMRSWKKHRIAPRTILIIEPNGCHGETLPGFCKYLSDLNYTIDVIIHHSVAAENPFSRISKQGISFFEMSWPFLKKLMNAPIIDQYEAIILTTSSLYWLSGKNDSPSSLDYMGLRSKSKVFIVEHEMPDIERFDEGTFVEHKRLITLGNFERGTWINPHYFGPISKNKKNSTTEFIIVGSLSPEKKNYRLLVNAMEELEVSCKKDYIVNIIGNSEIPKTLPNNIIQHLRLHGRLDFPRMYDLVEQSDFFLPLLDPTNPEHTRYITRGVTGSAQLIYGFLKPPVIHEKFSLFYGFSPKNSIIYRKSELGSAMNRAIELSAVDYSSIQESLRLLAGCVYKTSLMNFQEALSHAPGI